MARILLYDIEVTSDVGDSWQKWDTNIHHYRRNWYMLCFAYKWLGDKKTHVVAQPDFKLYKTDPSNDLEVVKALHNLFDQADVVIAHNGNRFDQKKAHARFIYHDLAPPSPYRQLDTKIVAKTYFNFTSNSLDDLGKYFRLGHKLETGGYGLWLGCEEGNPKAWKKMKQYNKQDVVLLEQVYLRMRPWIQNHPALNTLNQEYEACPKCGKGPMHKRGTYRTTNLSIYQRYQCQNCGGWNSGRKPIPVKDHVEYVNG